MNKIFSLRATYLSAFVKSLVVITLGFFVFYIDDHDFFDYRLTIAITICISIFKCAYFIGVSYQKILEVSLKNTAYYEFIIFMALNIFVIIVSFATDFFCLIQVDHRSLEGIKATLTTPEKIFECFYFSVLNFSFFGYGDILPATIPAKIVLMLEASMSFLTVILVLSDFISLKESIADYKKTKN
jgi:hypothetical protein